ncbi:peptidoglycan-binding protein [Sphingomonas sp. DBB INV C78]
MRAAMLLPILSILSFPAGAQRAAAVAPSVAPIITPPPVPRAPVPIAAPPAPVWPQLTAKQAEQLAGLLKRDAVAQGLRETEADLSAVRDNDALVRAALDHARAVHSGRLDKPDFQKNWGLRPFYVDPLAGFTDAVKRDRLADWVANLPPPYAGYDGLQKGLADYRKLETAGGWPTVSAGPDLSFGMSGPRVAELRKRLAVEDKQVSAQGDRFDNDLLEAVRRAQRRYGLNPSGLVSTQTLAALNVPVSARVRQIMANMERWRWLPAELPKDRVQVNIAAAVLTVFDGDAPVASMKAVTGRPGDETPMLESNIHSVVLNPPWNVPTSIATGELWPKERKNPGYLKRNNFKVLDGKRLQQAAGPSSALGRYKFDFNNNFSVYLHDTPTQATFSSFSRLASHGCVRLEKPAELANLLLNDDPAWSSEEIAATVARGKTVRARLQQPVAVYLLYWTAFASANGQMNFRADPYSWDSVLADKIAARSAARQSLAAR